MTDIGALVKAVYFVGFAIIFHALVSGPSMPSMSGIASAIDRIAKAIEGSRR